MNAYNVVLFLHILAAIVLVGGSMVGFVVARLARTATTVDGVRSWTQFGLFLNKAIPLAAVVTLLAGVYLVFAEWSWNTGWIVVSLALFVMAGATAGKVIDPHWKALHAEATAAPSGPVPTELATRLRDPKGEAVETMMVVSDVAIVFMMANKPGYAGALIVVGVAWAAGLALIAAGRRSVRPTVPSEVA